MLACALATVVAIGALGDLRTTGDAVDGAAFVSAAGHLRAAESPTALPQATGTPHLVEAFAKIPELWRPDEPEFSLADTQIISYYGNPYTAAMGILGTADPDTIASRLELHAALYDRLNGPTNVIPALHMVYAVAQPEPTEDGRYLLYVQDADVQRYITLAEERGMLLFLDLQIGRSSVEEELRRVLPYLRHSRVHLAIDPEFAVAEGQVPGRHLGSLSAAEINRAQEMLQELVREELLSPKLLIVHQFVDSMVRDGAAIERFPGVELIIDMDGFGPADVKRVIYRRYATQPYTSHPAIKLFFEQDPDLMSVAEVLSLEPRPVVIIYQ